MGPRPPDGPRVGLVPHPVSKRTGGDGRLTMAIDPHDQGPRTSAASSASGPPVRTSPSSPTSGCTPCSTAARSRPASRSATAARSWSTRTWGWSRRSSTSPRSTSLKGHLAIGHSRYSTTGASTWQNAQPTFRPTADGSIALGHNGNLINTHELSPDGHRPARDPDGELALHTRDLEASTNDTGLVTALLAHHPDTSLEQRALEVLPLLRGAFCFVWMNEDTLYAARDPQGIRPLVLGRLDRGWVVASEDAALATIGASVVREVEPGELIVIDENGLRSHTFAEPAPKGCVFEYVYLARPDATISGRSVHEARVEMGRRLAREFPVEADLVMPVPESGTPAASGLRRGERHPVRPGLRQERLRRPHLHPAQPDPAPARHPAQAQRARAHDPRQADRRGRRLDRARQHPARAGADAPRGRAPSRSTSASRARR